MKVKVIGLDLDGTLYEVTPEIRARMRGKIYEKISDVFDISVENSRNLFEEKYAVLLSGSRAVNEIAKQFGKDINGSDFVQEALQEADFLDLIEENPRLSRMLYGLSKNKRLDLLTGSPYSFALKKLNKLRIVPGVFRHILAGEDGSKSSGELYGKWVSLGKFSPRQHLYVGDNVKQDIEVPKKLGIKTCFVGSENSQADFHIESILDLEDLVINL